MFPITSTYSSILIFLFSCESLLYFLRCFPGEFPRRTPMYFGVGYDSEQGRRGVIRRLRFARGSSGVSPNGWSFHIFFFTFFFFYIFYLSAGVPTTGSAGRPLGLAACCDGGFGWVGVVITAPAGTGRANRVHLYLQHGTAYGVIPSDASSLGGHRGAPALIEIAVLVGSSR